MIYGWPVPLLPTEDGRCLCYHAQVGNLMIVPVAGYLAFGFDLVAIRLVLGLEIKVLMGWTEEHLTSYCQHLHTAGLLMT